MPDFHLPAIQSSLADPQHIRMRRHSYQSIFMASANHDSDEEEDESLASSATDESVSVDMVEIKEAHARAAQDLEKASQTKERCPFCARAMCSLLLVAPSHRLRRR